jgi:curved DNA-binding protein CbpA
MVYDYYEILGLPASADMQEIKMAYRKLAKQFHPDIVGSNQEKLLHFETIKTAYETLSNAQLRYQYHEQRWYLKSQGQQFTNYEPITVASIVKSLIAIEKEAYFMDVNSNAEEKIALKVSDILHEKNMKIVLQKNEDSVNQTIAQLLIKLMHFVPINYLPSISNKINTLQFLHQQKMQLLFLKEEKKIKQRLLLQRYKWVIAVFLIVTLLLFIKKM